MKPEAKVKPIRTLVKRFASVFTFCFSHEDILKRSCNLSDFFCFKVLNFVSLQQLQQHHLLIMNNSVFVPLVVLMGLTVTSGFVVLMVLLKNWIGEFF